MTVTDLLARLIDVRETSDGWLAICPSHADSRASLRVAVGETGRTLLKCRAGCTTPAVLEAMGLTYADLAEAGEPAATGPGRRVGREGQPGPGDIAALAVYAGECAARLGETRGQWPKAARTYLEDRFGIDGPTAVALGLGVDPGGRTSALDYLGDAYRAVPRLVVPFRDADGVARGLQARDLTGGHRVRWCGLTNGEGFAWSKVAVFDLRTGLDVVLVTEGPGDALTAVGAGYDAVAIRGAALGQNAEAVEALVPMLRGRWVVLAGDADKAGQDFNAAVGAHLVALGMRVHMLQLPGGVGDLTEWREADPLHFPDDLATAIREATRLAPQGAPSAPPPPPSGSHPLTDLGNAERLYAALEGRVRYSPETGFYLWDGTVWVLDRFDAVRAAAHDVTRAMVSEGERLAQATDVATQERGKKLLGWGKRSQSTRSIDSMVRELQSMPAVVVDVEAMDGHHHLLCFRNGTVNLRTGALRPHDPADLITRRVDVDYNPAATCPRWEAFLGEVFPGAPALPTYIQRLVGYGITGETTEQAFAVLWGTGANGKSVFTDTLTNVFRAVTTTTPFSTFEEKPSGGIPNDLAALKGARLVMASEGDRGRAMAEAVIKRVTGKDSISARFMRREFFEFRPTFLILLATNHRPAFRGQDEGLWRRVKLIPWARYFAPHERDHYLGEKLLAEAEGIAAWAVKGAVEWYARGLQDPAIVVDATRGYRETSDALDGFFPGKLEAAPGAEVLGADAYHAYVEWADDEGLAEKERWTRRTFYAALEERGIQRRKTMKGQALVGVRITGAPKAPPPEETRTPGEPPSGVEGVHLDDLFS